VSLAAQQGGAGSFTPLLLIVLLFAVMYFMMIRPQQKRRREAEQMQRALGAGDEIVTIGGLHATVVSVEDDIAVLEIAPGIQVRYARPAISKVLRRDEPPADDVVESAGTVDEPIQSPVVETKKSTD
jgi:preprotein translocase subunit YajC